jgi:hypothetical protein
MSFCPHCGDEIKEPVTFCPKCGELLDYVQAERTVLSEYMKHSLDVMKSNPSVLVPQLILTLASAIGGLLFSKLYGGADLFPEVQEAIMSGADLTPYYPLFKIGAAFTVVGFLFDLLFMPFLQHVYLGASKEEGVDFKKNFDATMSRLGEYVMAQLAVMVIPVTLLIGTFWLLTAGTVEEMAGTYAVGIFVLIGLLILMYFLSMGTQIMVWEGEKFRASVSLYFIFFQRRLGTLILLGIIGGIAGLLISFLPLYTYYSFVLDVFFNIATIDMYVNYRKMRK